MAKGKKQLDCPVCKARCAVEGTLTHGRCKNCGWVAIEPDKHRALDAESIGSILYPDRPAVEGCPGCGGIIEPLTKNAAATTGKLSLCFTCRREPIEYLRLAAGTQLRDQMAAAALTGFVSTMTKDDPRKLFDSDIPKSGMVIAQVSYILADAMLAEREKGAKQ